MHFERYFFKLKNGDNMSKTNKLKRKTTGFDVFYRVITAVLAIAIYPAFYFANLLTFEIVHSDISNLLNNFREEAALDATYDSISLAKLPEWVDMFSSFMTEDISISADILGNEQYRPVIAAVVFIAIALVLGLVILGFAIFSNKIKIITALSGAGFLSTLAAYISFTGFFAEPLLNGENTLAQLLNVDGIISSFLIGYLGDVTVLRLDAAFYSLMFLMLGILVWSLAVIVVNVSDEKEKAQKAMARASK